MAKISIIIPAYNAEKTIERTIRSVMASTIPLDVWVVDDGSTDGTGEILDGVVGEMSGSGRVELKVSVPLSNSDSPLKVIHQQNSGAYQARLNALKRITTPYFGFVDADDTVEPTMFEKMLDFAERERLDVVRCSYDGEEDLGLTDCRIGGLADCRGENQSVNAVAETRQTVFDAYVRPALIEGKMGGTFIWNMLYRNQYDFTAFDPTDHDTNFDDMIFNLQFFLKVERMGFLNEPLYHYATTAGSAVHSFGENKLKDFREVCRVRRALLPQYGVDPDGAENRAWFKLNRMSCIKSTIRAGNLTWAQKVSIVGRLMRWKNS